LSQRDLYMAAAETGAEIRRIQTRRDSLEDIFLRAMEYEGQARPSQPQAVAAGMKG